MVCCVLESLAVRACVPLSPLSAAFENDMVTSRCGNAVQLCRTQRVGLCPGLVALAMPTLRGTRSIP